MLEPRKSERFVCGRENLRFATLYLGSIFFVCLSLCVPLDVAKSEVDSSVDAPTIAPSVKPNSAVGTILLDREVDKGKVQKRRGKHVRAKRQRDQWWQKARRTLFSGIKLTPDQSAEITQMIRDQKQNRTNFSKLDVQLAVARSENDIAKARELRGKTKAARESLQSVHVVLDSIRGVLTPEQRPTFDVNRAKLVAEGQAIRADQKKKSKKVRQPDSLEGAGSPNNAEMVGPSVEMKRQ